MHLDVLAALSDNYIWLLADADGRALVVDPGEADPVETALTRNSLRLEAILLTHHHADHVGAAATLRERHGATVYAPHDARIEAVDQRVGEGDSVTLATPHVDFQVWEVPGHTRSHIAFIGEGLLFCGDTLFSLGCGRVFEGTAEQMLDSLDRLTTLPDDTRVCCGHEYTLANAAFACTVEPDNAALAEHVRRARRARSLGQPSLPSRMHEERAANPFLRVDAPGVMQWSGNLQSGREHRIQRFAALRKAKDGFSA